MNDRIGKLSRKYQIEVKIPKKNKLNNVKTYYLIYDDTKTSGITSFGDKKTILSRDGEKQDLAMKFADEIVKLGNSLYNIEDYEISDLENGKVIVSLMSDDFLNERKKLNYPVISESDSISVSKGMKYHIDNKIPLVKNVYRPGSDKFFQLWNEARDLHTQGRLFLAKDDLEIIKTTDLGKFGEYYDYTIGSLVERKINGEWDSNKIMIVENVGNNTVRLIDGNILNTKDKDYRVIPNQVPLDFPLIETEYQGKQVELNKPKRGGSKKFYVYVMDPKTKKVKKVSFGAAGGGQNLAVKIKDPKARKAFSERHNCSQKKDKTTPGYWACRVPRYAKQLGLSGSYGGYW